jgi:hypothetical protein
MRFHHLLFLPLVLCVIVAEVNGQVNTYVRALRPSSAQENSPAVISAELQFSANLQRVVLFYRSFGQSEYTMVEMQILRDSAVVEIPAAKMQPPFIEAYISATDLNGITETFPFVNPEVQPARIMVSPAPKYEVIILSPEQGEQITGGETYISISFVYADEKTDRSKTKILLNGIDLSDKAMMFDDLLIVPPDAIPASLLQGGINLSVQTFDSEGNRLTSMRRGFDVISETEAEEIRSSFRGFGNAQAETRRENIKGIAKTYNRLDVRAAASYLEILKATTNITLTSEEKPENQPQNRYFVGLDARYVKLGLGDAYPRFPSTIMDGRRIRGYTFDLLLGAFNLNTASGEIIRRVEFNSVPQTLKRTMTVVRPSFGKGENFQWGFTYLKSKDDFDPLQPVVVRPQENVVFGSDMLIGIDRRRIEITAQSALSLNNVDISLPEFNSDSIDAAVARGTFDKDDADQLKKILPLARNLITVNENLVPVNPAGLTSLVYETAISFNYFGNFLKAAYIFHGKDYASSGASTIRKDIEGYNITDRLRLLDNRLFLTGSYEELKNNTSGFEIATTTYKTINTSVSYYPARNYPNITVGYGQNKNANPIDPFDTADVVARQIALRAVDDLTNRYFLQTSYDFSYWGQQNVSFNLDISDKDDRTPKEQDVSTFNTVMLVSTTHNLRLESSVGLSVSSLTFPQADSIGQITKGTLGYQTLSLTGRYKIYKELLRVTGTFAPTFGDLSRILFETSVQYSITDHQLAVLQFQFIHNTSSALAAMTSKNDSFVSLLYRIDF